MSSDLELLSRYVEQDDRDALNELFSRHYPSVYHTLLKLVHNETTARDLAQETFLNALRAARNYRPTGSIRGWILAIAINEARQFWRAPKRFATHDELEALFADLRQESPDRLASRRELERAMEEALERLPEKLKVPIVLHYYERLSLAEIAAILDLPKSTVQRRCEDALWRLRRLFRKGGHAALFPLFLGSFPELDPALRTSVAAPTAAVSFWAVFSGLLAMKHVLIPAMVLLSLFLGYVFLRPDPSATDRRAASAPSVETPGEGSERTGAVRSSGPGRPDVDPSTETAAAPMERIESQGPGTIVGCVLRRSDYAPVEGVRIRVVPASRAFENHYYSRKDGSFLCSRLPLEESYALLMTHPKMGYREQSDVALTVSRPSADVGAFLVEEGEMLRGIVRDPEGRPVPEASVRAGNASSEADPQAGNLIFIPNGLATATDAEGRFEIGPLSSGYHDLLVQKDGYMRWDSPDFRISSGSAPAEWVVTLEPGGTLLGRVVDEAGKGIPGATVEGNLGDAFSMLQNRCIRIHSPFSLKSDPEGRFRLNNLSNREGDLRLNASAEGFLPAETELDLNAVRRSPEVTLTLRSVRGPCAVYIRLQEASSGKPLPPEGANFTLALSSGTYRYRGRPDLERGWVEFAHVAEGSYHLSGYLPAFTAVSQEVSVTAASAVVDVKLERGRRLHGVAYDSGTRLPIAGARVTTIRWTDDAVVVTGPDGSYEIAWIPELNEGITYKDALRVCAEDFEETHADVVVPKGAGEIRIDIPMTRSGRRIEEFVGIRGEVVDEKGGVLPGCVVALENVKPDSGIGLLSERTDREGRFLFAGVRPEAIRPRLEFHVRHPAYPIHVFTEPKEKSASILRLVLSEGWSISGSVVDETGAPVPFAVVLAMKTSGGTRLLDLDSYLSFDPDEGHTARCDDQGRFAFPALPRDTMHLVPFISGFRLSRAHFPHRYLVQPGASAVVLPLEKEPEKK